MQVAHQFLCRTPVHKDLHSMHCDAPSGKIGKKKIKKFLLKCIKLVQTDNSELLIGCNNRYKQDSKSPLNYGFELNKNLIKQLTS
jgi:hypothetical protein